MKKALVFATLIFVLGWVNVVKADQIFVTPPGSTAGGESVSALVDFSLSGNTLTIVLTNTLPGIQDAGQLLTDVFFTLSPSPTGTPELSSQTGDLIKLAKDSGAVTDLGSSTLGWGFGAATVDKISGFELCVICQGGPSAGATPSEGILGPSPNGNGSINGNKPHNPFVNQTATFMLTGVPEDATVGNVIFSFSTQAGVNVRGTPDTPNSPTPEPASLILVGTGLLGLGAKLRRRFKA